MYTFHCAEATPPTITSIVISPPSPTRATALSCIPSTTSSSQSPAFTYRNYWTRNGVIQGALNNTLNIASGLFVRGDVINCFAQPLDGGVAGDWYYGTSAITIRMSPRHARHACRCLSLPLCCVVRTVIRWLLVGRWLVVFVCWYVICNLRSECSSDYRVAFDHAITGACGRHTDMLNRFNH